MVKRLYVLNIWKFDIRICFDHFIRSGDIRISDLKLLIVTPFWGKPNPVPMGQDSLPLCIKDLFRCPFDPLGGIPGIDNQIGVFDDLSKVIVTVIGNNDRGIHFDQHLRGNGRR